jgi:hypothetical protein
MSDMEKRYNESKAPRVAEARQIPKLAVDFVDMQDQWQKGWTNDQKKGDPTTFTTKALDYYNTEVKNISVPDGYQPIEQGVQINRYTPEKKYFVPGAPGN